MTVTYENQTKGNRCKIAVRLETASCSATFAAASTARAGSVIGPRVPACAATSSQPSTRLSAASRPPNHLKGEEKMSVNDTADLQATVAGAVGDYASQGGDGFRDDWRGALEYRDEGFRLGEAAFRMFSRDGCREESIDGAAEKHPASARYLISWAARLRIAELELEREASKGPPSPLSSL